MQLSLQSSTYRFPVPPACVHENCGCNLKEEGPNSYENCQNLQTLEMEKSGLVAVTSGAESAWVKVLQNGIGRGQMSLRRTAPQTGAYQVAAKHWQECHLMLFYPDLLDVQKDNLFQSPRKDALS